MPSINKIKVTYKLGQVIKCQIWDNIGVEHDARSIFQQVRGATGSGTPHDTEFSFKNNHVNLTQTIKVQPTEKELEFVVPPETIKLILALLGP